MPHQAARHPPERDAANWARPVDRLSAAGVTGTRRRGLRQARFRTAAGLRPALAEELHRSPRGGRRHAGSADRDLEGALPEFWPKGQRFYAPLSGIDPGEVALLEIQPLPGAPVKLSTGVLVLYADDESFTFMTPEGHTLSAWITFSASRDGEVTVARAEALERPADPFDDLAYNLIGNRRNNQFWEATLRNLATRVGVAETGRRRPHRLHRPQPAVALLAERP